MQVIIYVLFNLNPAILSGCFKATQHGSHPQKQDRQHLYKKDVFEK